MLTCCSLSSGQKKMLSLGIFAYPVVSFFLGQQKTSWASNFQGLLEEAGPEFFFLMLILLRKLDTKGHHGTVSCFPGASVCKEALCHQTCAQGSQRRQNNRHSRLVFTGQGQVTPRPHRARKQHAAQHCEKWAFPSLASAWYCCTVYTYTLRQR